MNRRDAWLVAAAALVFVAVTTEVNWIKYLSLRSTYPHDLGAFHNQMLNAASGRDRSYLYGTAWHTPGDHDGASVYRSAHFTPLRMVLLPLVYRAFPHILTLMLAQAVLIAAGALALHAFASARTGLRWPGLVLAGSYLLHPVVLQLAFNDFRELACGVGPALLALYAYSESRWRLFVPAALLMLCARTEWTFLLAVFPLLAWRTADPAARKRAGWIVAPLVLATAWYSLVTAYDLHYYGKALVHFSRSGGVPGRLLDLPARLPAFLRLFLLPGIAGLLTPEALFAALPFLAGAKGLTPPAEPHHHLHHLSPALAALFWGFGGALVRYAPLLSRTARRRRGAVLGLALVAVFGAIPLAVLVARGLRGAARYAQLTEIDAALPRDATVLVPSDLVARFSAHWRVINTDTLPFAAEPVDDRAAVLAKLVEVADLVALGKDATLARAVAESNRFELAGRVAGFSIYRSRADAPRAAEPDRELERVLCWDRLSPLQRLGLDLGS